MLIENGCSKIVFEFYWNFRAMYLKTTSCCKCFHQSSSVILFDTFVILSSCKKSFFMKLQRYIFSNCIYDKIKIFQTTVQFHSLANGSFSQLPISIHLLLTQENGRIRNLSDKIEGPNRSLACLYPFSLIVFVAFAALSFSYIQEGKGFCWMNYLMDWHKSTSPAMCLFFLGV